MRVTSKLKTDTPDELEPFDLEPATDAPPCGCGEGVLLPILYHQGMLKPVAPPKRADGFTGQNLISSSDMRCTASARTFPVKMWRAMRAWWSVGAYEQKLFDARRVISSKHELHPDSSPGS